MNVKRIICLCLFPVIGFAFGESKEYTIGLSVWSGYPDSVAGFKSALKEAGLTENKQVTYILRNAEGDRDKQVKIAKEFRDTKVDLVYSLTTPGTVIIKEYLPSSTPIVYSIVTYPADSGLIESLDYSGNNLVGTSNFVPLKNYVNILKNILPAAKKVGVFRRDGEPNSKIQAVNLIRIFNRAGIESIDLPAKSVEEVRSLALVHSKKVDVFVTTTDTLMQSGGEQALIEVSLKEKIPVLSSNKQGIVGGSTFGPVVDFETLGKMSGEMAVKILSEGAEPSSISSRLQNPPIILINKHSLEVLSISSPENLRSFEYVD